MGRGSDRIGPILAGVAAAALTASGLGACSSGEADRTIDVYAASSLTDAFGALEESFEAEHPDVDIRLNLAGSNTLLRQILDGAEADVYAPADAELLAAVTGDLVDVPAVFATNRLALVVPAEPAPGASTVTGGDGAFRQPADVADDRFLIARCAAGVPCGDATDRYLAGAGLSVGRSTDEANVRSVLRKVTSGEVDAGFVYLTDALAGADGVREIDLPGAPTVELAIAVLSLDDEATAFADHVTSPEGADVFRSHGFIVP